METWLHLKHKYIDFLSIILTIIIIIKSYIYSNKFSWTTSNIERKNGWEFRIDASIEPPLLLFNYIGNVNSANDWHCHQFAWIVFICSFSKTTNNNNWILSVMSGIKKIVNVNCFQYLNKETEICHSFFIIKWMLNVHRSHIQFNGRTVPTRAMYVECWCNMQHIKMRWHSAHAFISLNRWIRVMCLPNDMPTMRPQLII